MDFQYKGEASGDIDLENEYEIEFKIESLSLTQHQPDDFKLFFIFGDFVHKMTVGEKGSMQDLALKLTMHSVPSDLSTKLLNIPIMLYIVSKEPDLKPLGYLKIVFQDDLHSNSSEFISLPRFIIC